MPSDSEDAFVDATTPDEWQEFVDVALAEGIVKENGQQR